MSDENDAGASYLAALKKSSAPQSAGAAPARAPESPRSDNSRTPSFAPPSEAGAANREKRKGPRYKCKGSVRIQESGSAVSGWATFADISMHGCYVESSAPNRQGTLVDLILDANGFRVESAGEVRVAYPGLGMGISFTKMSETDRGRLRELVGSVSSRAVIQGPRFAAQAVSTAQPETPVITDPGAALQAMLKFFADRQMMGREEFLRILRKS